MKCANCSREALKQSKYCYRCVGYHIQAKPEPTARRSNDQRENRTETKNGPSGG